MTVNPNDKEDDPMHCRAPLLESDKHFRDGSNCRVFQRLMKK